MMTTGIEGGVGTIMGVSTTGSAATAGPAKMPIATVGCVGPQITAAEVLTLQSTCRESRRQGEGVNVWFTNHTQARAALLELADNPNNGIFRCLGMFDLGAAQFLRDVMRALEPTENGRQISQLGRYLFGRATEKTVERDGRKRTIVEYPSGKALPGEELSWTWMLELVKSIPAENTAELLNAVTLNAKPAFKARDRSYLYEDHEDMFDILWVAADSIPGEDGARVRRLRDAAFKINTRQRHRPGTREQRNKFGGKESRNTFNKNNPSGGRAG